jgi:hypothetical protein
MGPEIRCIPRGFYLLCLCTAQVNIFEKIKYDGAFLLFSHSQVNIKLPEYHIGHCYSALFPNLKPSAWKCTGNGMSAETVS